MKWKRKLKTNYDGTPLGLLPKVLNRPKEPKIGDRRSRKRFAYTPTVVGEHKVWLEYYNEVFEYKTFTVRAELTLTLLEAGYTDNSYETTDWKLIDKKVIYVK